MISRSEQVTADLLDAQFGGAYAGYDATERARHVALLQAIARAEDVAVHAERKADDLWMVTVCAPDHVGALSLIAGLFSSYRLDIISADVFTLRLPASQPTPRPAPGRRRRPPPRLRGNQPEAPLRRLLDVFRVRPLDDITPPPWDRLKTDLSTLTALLSQGQESLAREQIVGRVSEVFRAFAGDAAQLFPIAVDVDNDEPASPTRLTIRSADTLGFLFAFTNALADLGVNIERAQVRTIRGEAHDTLWVTDASGRPIVDESHIHQLRVATALIKQFTHLLPRSPNPAQALRQFEALIAQMLSRPEWTLELQDLESTAVLQTLAQLMGVSRFLWEDFLRMQHENLFPVVLDMPALDERRPREELRRELGRLLAESRSESASIDTLNSFKDREMFRIDLRHITGRLGFREFSEELSALAEVVVEATADLCRQALQRDLGLQGLGSGADCPWCICALGKFGGSELGFGSDIELVFLYQDTGKPSGPGLAQNAAYFEEFVRRFLATLKARQEGIFEIDLRLRPYGRLGAFASTLDGFRRYYAKGGEAQQFERMALVRLRPIVGGSTLGQLVMEARDAFVYSEEPLDLENIRHLRRRQALELVPAGKTSAKYSPGGLVDIEYYTQARQISVGHVDPHVRVTNTLDAIERLVQGGHLDCDEASHLSGSYRFLRRLIDALRVVRGHAKDLTLPPGDSREFAYLAQRLEFEGTDALGQAIEAQMGLARALWEPGPLTASGPSVPRR